jgi:hypothetical protein
VHQPPHRDSTRAAQGQHRGSARAAQGNKVIHTHGHIQSVTGSTVCLQVSVVQSVKGRLDSECSEVASAVGTVQPDLPDIAAVLSVQYSQTCRSLQECGRGSTVRSACQFHMCATARPAWICVKTCEMCVQHLSLHETRGGLAMQAI